MVRLSFIYGRKDRRVIKFVMEDADALEEFLELLNPIAMANKAGKVSS